MARLRRGWTPSSTAQVRGRPSLEAFASCWVLVSIHHRRAGGVQNLADNPLQLAVRGCDAYRQCPVYIANAASPRTPPLTPGYEYSYPFLDLAALGLSTSQQHVAPLYQHLFHPGLGPGLAFIGLPFRVAAFAMLELQAALCAR